MKNIKHRHLVNVLEGIGVITKSSKNIIRMKRPPPPPVVEPGPDDEEHKQLINEVIERPHWFLQLLIVGYR